jgi:hypothetical protein
METLRPHIDYMDGEWVTVMVPTEHGEWCHIQFRRCLYRRSWEIEVADELIRQSPEAIHAALGLALMELREVTP